MSDGDANQIHRGLLRIIRHYIITISRDDVSRQVQMDEIASMSAIRLNHLSQNNLLRTMPTLYAESAVTIPFVSFIDLENVWERKSGIGFHAFKQM